MSTPSSIGTAASAVALSIASVAGQYLGDIKTTGTIVGAGLLAGLSNLLANQLHDRWRKHGESKERLTDVLHNEHLAIAAEDALKHAILSAGISLRVADRDVADGTLEQLAEAAAAHWRALHLARAESVEGFNSQQLAERVVEHLTADDPMPRILLPAWKAILRDAAAKAQLTLGFDEAAWNALAGHVTREYSTRLYNAFKSDLRASGDGGSAFAGIVLRLLADLHRSVRELADGDTEGGGSDNTSSAAELKPLIRRLRRIADGVQRDTKGLINHLDTTTRTALAEFIEPLHEDVRTVRKGQRKQWNATVAALVLTTFVLGSVWWMISLFERPEFDRPRIRAQLLESSERQRNLDFAAAERAVRSDERQRLRESAEAAHQSRTARIDEVVARFAELEGRDETTRIARELARILADEGVDPALSYIEREKSGILSDVRAHLAAERERTRAKLAPLLSGADLQATKGQVAAARRSYRELLELDPAWPDALSAFAWFLHDRSIQSELHGALRDAIADAEEAQVLAARLNAVASASPAARRLLAATHSKIGDLLATRGQAGDAEQALAHYTRCHDLLERLLTANPGSAEAARDVSVSLNKLGDFLATRGQPGDAEQALVQHTRSLEIREKLLTANPGSAEAARDVSVSLNKLGDFLATRGQPGDVEQALAHYMRCHDVLEKLLTANPGSAEAARDVSVSLNKLGNFLASRGQLGDAEQALAHYTRSLEICEKLLTANPGSGQAARDVSVNLNKLGDFLATRGQPGDAEQALAHYTRDLEISEKLLTANPGSAEAARDVSVSLNKLGDFLATRGQPGDVEQALAHYTRSLEITERLLTANPGSAEAARNVSVSLNKLGDFLATRGQPDDAEQALAHYTRCLEITEKLLTANPGSAQAARDVSVSLNKLGNFLATRGRPGDAEQALAYYSRDLEISEKLLTANPGFAWAARDVSVSLNQLGDFLATRGQPGDAEQALAHYSRSLEISEKLLTTNPDSAQAARDVSVSLNKLGNFLATRGQPGDAEQALTHYTRDLEISEKLLMANPSSAQAARDVAVSCAMLARLAQRTKKGDAKRYWRRAYDIWEGMKQKGIISQGDLKILEALREKVGK